MAATTIAHEILDIFIISLDLVPKMQTLDLLFPSWRSWHNERSSARFKRRKSLEGLLSLTDYYEIQTNTILPNKQNRNLASPTPKRKKITCTSFLASFI
jgi:hypothetical protein